MASGTDDDGDDHVVEVVHSGASVTRWVPDGDGGVEHLEDTGWEIDRVAARCSCGLRFGSESQALTHLEAVGAEGKVDEREAGRQQMYEAMQLGEEGPHCRRCGKQIEEPDELAVEGSFFVHESCAAGVEERQ